MPWRHQTLVLLVWLPFTQPASQPASKEGGLEQQGGCSKEVITINCNGFFVGTLFISSGYPDSTLDHSSTLSPVIESISLAEVSFRNPCGSHGPPVL